MPSGFEEDYRERLLEGFRQSLQIMPGVRQVMERLAMPFCVATSSSPRRVEMSLLLVGLWSLVIALAWFDRSPRNIAIALAVVFFYGGMVFGVLPTQGYISFESHLSGAIAGDYAAFTLSKKPAVEILAPVGQNELKFWPQDKVR